MVERYFASGGIHPCDDGEWVSYDEYAALQAENDRLKAERVDLEQFRPALVALSDYAYDLHSDVDHPDCVDADRLLALIDAHKGE
jgi:hypothetical protein